MQISSLHHRLPCRGLMVQFHHLLILLKHLLTHTRHRLTQLRTRFFELLLGLWSHISCDKWLSGCIWTSTLYLPRFCCSGHIQLFPFQIQVKVFFLKTPIIFSLSMTSQIPQISYNLLSLHLFALDGGECNNKWTSSMVFPLWYHP